MVDYGKVRSTVKPESIVVDEYSVWENSNIAEISEVIDEENGVEKTEYEYDMVQYTKDEYTLKQAELSKEMESMLNTILISLSGEDAQGEPVNEQG